MCQSILSTLLLHYLCHDIGGLLSLPIPVPEPALTGQLDERLLETYIVCNGAPLPFLHSFSLILPIGFSWTVAEQRGELGRNLQVVLSLDGFRT